jgi:4-alpha-glucanotransferase
MGESDANIVPADSEPVRVIRAGVSANWNAVGDLTLEDGTVLPVKENLPPDLPLGYHHFQSADHPGRMWVIVAPTQCVLPPRPAWGWAAQLYATRSPESWGIGDMGDLRRVGQWAARLGAGFLMVNPLGAVAPVVPQESSPYYPSSRRYFNPIYLRVEDVPGARQLGPMLDQLAAAGRVLNHQRQIDRNSVFRLKEEALKSIFSRFQPDDDFDRFCRCEGPDLHRFATYCVLAEEHGGDWRQWPLPYRLPQNRAVELFAESHAREVRYHQWLQWLLDRQLAEAGKPVPLVQDLPVGVQPGGADAWMWQDLLARDCNVGAPPDMFNSRGQDWGLPPFVPHKLRAAGYQPFVQTIRAALRHGGGLRIDHVMALFRLYWIPAGLSPRQGAYVRYRAEEMLAIVALESHRAGAFIVGEDLGNVEPGVRERLAAERILSYRLLWFEERPPTDYPELAMAAVTTHDLPTIAGLWTGTDQQCQQSPTDEAMCKMRLMHRAHLQVGDNTTTEDVIVATYRRLAEARSLFLVATLDDALGVCERPNMPGTTTEWPNWSLALPGGIPALEESQLPERIARELDRSQVAAAASQPT